MRRIGRGADRLDGQHGSYYLNYNNLINTPTIPTNNNQLTNGAGYITTSALSGLDADLLDGVQGASYLRSDANDTFTGDLTINGWVYVNVAGNNLVLQSDTSTRTTLEWEQNSTDIWNLQLQADGDLNFDDAQGGNAIRIDDNLVWHAGNDGSGSGLDADLLDGQHGSHYLNYNNLSNTPTIPTNNNQLTNGAGYVTSSGWTSSNDGSGSGLDADYLDGYHYDSRWLNGASGQNHYVAANYGYNWFRPVNDTGVYLNSYGAHWYRTQSSYGTWQAHGYTLNGYVGLQTYYSYQNNLMYDSGGSGGMYQQNGAGWQFYFNRGHHCLGVGGSTTNSSYELYVNGDLYATGNVVAYSDVRAKENIETIDNALDKVSKLRGVYYTWKKGERGNDKARKEGKRQMGVIAQEILEVCPEVVVQETDDMDRYSVDYGKLTGILIEAVKDLKKEINELKSN